MNLLPLPAVTSRPQKITQLLIARLSAQYLLPSNLEQTFHHTLGRRPYRRNCKTTYSTLSTSPRRAADRNAYQNIPIANKDQRLAPIANGEQVLQRELANAEAVIQPNVIPQESHLSQALEVCERLAKSISSQLESSAIGGDSTKSPTSSLLTLEELNVQDVNLEPPSNSPRGSWRDEIEATAYRIVTDPLTFITPRLLRTYVRTLAALGRPRSFPYIFDLFASKPVPIVGSSPIAFRTPEPTSFRNAIPIDIARQALDAAIVSRNLALCLNVTRTTVATNAFRRNKALRKLSLPTTFLALTPWISYELALLYVEYSPRLTPIQAFGNMFVGSMTFFSMNAITGYIFWTTGYWQERVTWKPGTPLHIRWLREEERAFMDEIAQRWGFQDDLKHGEEEGEDWAILRELLMDDRMELDRPERMEGME